MGAIAIVLGLGICVFLLWFFESIQKDIYSDDINETEYVYMRRNSGSRDNQEQRVIRRQEPCVKREQEVTAYEQAEVTAYEQASRRRAS